jgi:predicted regulator of Ras-like GTPase activity (Roadblock/LC7/MglB family)
LKRLDAIAQGETMQQLIDDLKSTPGVIGAYVFHSKEGVRFSNLPSIFKPDRIAEITKSLIKIHGAGKQNFPDLVEVFINYEESMLFCRQFNASEYLIAVCDPGMNLNVLAMSLNLALEEITGQSDATQSSPAVTGQEPAGAPAASPTQEQTPASSAVSSTSSELYETGPLAKPLQEMSKMLAKILGPMAVIVFEDTVAKWAKGRTPSPSELPALVESLCLEIDDSEKAKRYQELVHSHMPSA